LRKILLVEDDRVFLETIEDFLLEEDFEIDTALDGEIALELTYKNRYDLYLLDINMPFLNGLDFLKSLRDTGDLTPAIFVTSANDKESLTNGFKIGCDDFIKKPFDLDELLFRINAILKRVSRADIVEFDNFKFDLQNYKLTKGEKEFELSLKESSLLSLFVENREQVVTKDMIIDRLWSSSQSYSEGSIRVYINNLKKLLGKERIKNLRGVGYKFMWN